MCHHLSANVELHRQMPPSLGNCHHLSANVEFHRQMPPSSCNCHRLSEYVEAHRQQPPSTMQLLKPSFKCSSTHLNCFAVFVVDEMAPTKKAKANPSYSGGVNQRLRQEEAAHQERISAALGADPNVELDGTGFESHLACCLIWLWAWGEISPQRIQFIADRCCKDIDELNLKHKIRYGLENENLAGIDELKNLAQIGTHGRNPNNCSRDLLKLLPTIALNAISWCMLPKKANTPAGFTMESFAFIMPHILFSKIYHNYKSAWSKFVLQSQESLAAFWDDMQGNPQLEAVPARPDMREKCIPLAIHGDGTPVTGVGKAWSKQYDVWSWCSLLGRGTTEELTFYIVGFYCRFLSIAFGGSTYSHIARKLKWSFQQLWEGKYSHLDENGVPYPPVNRGCSGHNKQCFEI